MYEVHKIEGGYTVLRDILGPFALLLSTSLHSMTSSELRHRPDERSRPSAPLPRHILTGSIQCKGKGVIIDLSIAIVRHKGINIRSFLQTSDDVNTCTPLPLFYISLKPPFFYAHHRRYNHKINRRSRHIGVGRPDENSRPMPSSLNQVLKSFGDILYPFHGSSVSAQPTHVVLQPFPTARTGQR